jgi:hypothetical protein
MTLRVTLSQISNILNCWIRLLSYIFFPMAFTTYRYCRIALWPTNISHTKVCHWTRYQDNSADVIYSQSVLIIYNLRLSYRSSGFQDICAPNFYVNLTYLTFATWHISVAFEITLPVSPWKYWKNPFISEDFVNFRNMKCVWWNIQFLTQRACPFRLSPVVYIPLIQSYVPNLEVIFPSGSPRINGKF